MPTRCCRACRATGSTSGAGTGRSLAARGTERNAARKRTTEMLDLVQLGHLKDRSTRQLSSERRKFIPSRLVLS